MSYTSSIFQCPDCAQPITFSHDAVSLKKCNCGTVVFRDSIGVLKSKPVNVVADRFDIIQPGTTGIWNGKKFTVLGRIRAWNKASVYNYWTIITADSEALLLAEGYGIYAILEKTITKMELNKGFMSGLKVFDKKDLMDVGAPFILERKAINYRWDLEGEAMMPEYDHDFGVFEFAAPNGNRISVFEWQKGVCTAFATHYVSFSSLGLRHLRTYTYHNKKINCSKCASIIDITTFPLTQSVACKKCGTLHIMDRDGDFKSKGEGNKIDINPAIPLGSEGVIKDIKYKVIGFAQKEENNLEGAQWKEYTLFNAEEGFAFLSEYSGHWTYVRENPNAPVPMKNEPATFKYDDVSYDLYNSYSYSLLYAAGELPYDISEGDDKKVREYIAPPKMWIHEKNTSTGSTWFTGEYMSRSVLKKSFEFPDGIPYSTGFGAIQPSGAITIDKLIKFVIAVSTVFLLLHVIIGFFKEERVVASGSISFSDSTNKGSWVTDKFKLDKWSSNLAFYVVAEVDNSWVELEATLVDADKGTEYSTQQGVEYYHGYSDGESWKEGSKSATGYLYQIPPGNYYLQLEGTRDVSLPSVQQMTVEVKYDVQTHKNLLIGLILFLVLPIGKFIQIQYREQQRWSHTDNPLLNNNDD